MKVKYALLVALSALGCVILGSVVNKVCIHVQKDKNIVSTEYGISEIKKLESKNVVELEKKINSMKKETLDKKNFKSIFSNSVIMGDSISEGLVGYGILNKSSVVAVKGRNTSTAMKDIPTTINLQPSNVFLTYGMNDIAYFSGNIDNFIKQYKKMINEIKTNLPQTDIYITGILPVQQKAINKQHVYVKLDQFNEALKVMCNENGLTFVETKQLLSEDSKYYEPDGIHVKMGFYPIWLDVLAKAANLY